MANDFGMKCVFRISTWLDKTKRFGVLLYILFSSTPNIITFEDSEYSHSFLHLFLKFFHQHVTLFI